MAVLMALASQNPEPAAALNPEVPLAFSELIERLLAKDPTQRVGSAKEVVEQIAAIERERAQVKFANAPTEASFSPVSPDSPRMAASQAFNFEESSDSFLSDDDFEAARKAKETPPPSVRQAVAVEPYPLRL